VELVEKALTMLCLLSIFALAVNFQHGYANTEVVAMTNGLSASQQDFVCTTGTLVFVQVEGGFMGILGDDGHHYDPVNLMEFLGRLGPTEKLDHNVVPSSFLADHLDTSGGRIWFRAKIVKDAISYHMWGTIVSLIQFASLSDLKLDFKAICQAFYSRLGEERYVNSYDFDRNGRIDMRDISAAILIAALSK
jgi:hypothetical protein